MLKTCIIGASGYSGEELIKLIARHPEAELACVTSRSLAGEAVAHALPAVRGFVSHELEFTTSDPASLAKSKDIDVYFLALPHGVSHEYAVPLVAAGKIVIDLSADFRLHDPETYHQYYGRKHPAPELLAKAPYVIPELAEDGWQDATLIACPGCYPTSTLLPLVPLLKAKAISSEGIVVNSYSGVSGAGKKASEQFLFTERNESCKPYGIPKHRHLSEIEEQLEWAAGQNVTIQFSPHLAPVARGILTTIVAKNTGGNADAILRETYPAESPFVHILPEGEFPDTRHVAHTNQAHIAAVDDERTGNVILTCAIDNLVKGASGQAVQIMNLRFGLKETAGLA